MAKKLPDFASEEEERKFWETHDVRDYIDWRNADSFLSRVFRNKKNTSDLLKDLKQMDS